jgi:hypothetical protein
MISVDDIPILKYTTHALNQYASSRYDAYVYPKGTEHPACLRTLLQVFLVYQ